MSVADDAALPQRGGRVVDEAAADLLHDVSAGIDRVARRRDQAGPALAQRLLDRGKLREGRREREQLRAPAEPDTRARDQPLDVVDTLEPVAEPQPQLGAGVQLLDGVEALADRSGIEQGREQPATQQPSPHGG